MALCEFRNMRKSVRAPICNLHWWWWPPLASVSGGQISARIRMSDVTRFPILSGCHIVTTCHQHPRVRHTLNTTDRDVGYLLTVFSPDSDWRSFLKIIWFVSGAGGVVPPTEAFCLTGLGPGSDGWWHHNASVAIMSRNSAVILYIHLSMFVQNVSWFPVTALFAWHHITSWFLLQCSSQWSS